MYYLYEVDDSFLFRFNKKNRTLLGPGMKIGLTIAESILLSRLCELKIQSGEIVERDVLKQAIWDDSECVDRSANLNQVACTLRKKIHLISSSLVIVTVPKKGYCLAEGITVIFKKEPCSLSFRKKKKEREAVVGQGMLALTELKQYKGYENALPSKQVLFSIIIIMAFLVVLLAMVDETPIVCFDELYRYMFGVNH